MQERVPHLPLEAGVEGRSDRKQRKVSHRAERRLCEDESFLKSAAQIKQKQPPEQRQGSCLPRASQLLPQPPDVGRGALRTVHPREAWPGFPVPAPVNKVTADLLSVRHTAGSWAPDRSASQRCPPPPRPPRLLLGRPPQAGLGSRAEPQPHPCLAAALGTLGIEGGT